MSGTERRNQIVERIKKNAVPVSGTMLAKEFEVSRQVIVQDIALIRAAGYDIISTHRGYLLNEPISVNRIFKVQHTDEQTEEPDDGKALFGRDAMANYMFVGARQLGGNLFEVKDGKMTLNFDKEIVRKLWDNYYVPYVKGYFAASGRFRSDDIKTGNILAYVGSTSSATFFPTQVMTSDTESHDIELEVLTPPEFEGGKKVAVQQGAGMVVTKGSDEEIEASVEFLKYLTEPENNTSFSIGSGYLPVTKKANDMVEIRKGGTDLPKSMDKVLTKAVETVNNNELYTTPAFEGGQDARSVLEYSMSDLADADRKAVQERIDAGQTMEAATEEFLTEEYFDRWYEDTLTKLQTYEG